MITLTHRKVLLPPMRVGCRVRAIRRARDHVFEEGAEGKVIELDNGKDEKSVMTIKVRFDKGSFHGPVTCDWWGYKEDFKVIG